MAEGRPIKVYNKWTTKSKKAKPTSTQQSLKNDELLVWLKI